MKFKVTILKHGMSDKGKKWYLVKAVSDNLAVVGFARGAICEALARDGVVEGDNIVAELGKTNTITFAEDYK